MRERKFRSNRIHRGTLVLWAAARDRRTRLRGTEGDTFQRAATNETRLASETALGSKGHRPDNLPTNLANQHRATTPTCTRQTAFSSARNRGLLAPSASPASKLAEPSTVKQTTQHTPASGVCFDRASCARSFRATRYSLEDRALSRPVSAADASLWSIEEEERVYQRIVWKESEVESCCSTSRGRRYYLWPRMFVIVVELLQ